MTGGFTLFGALMLGLLASGHCLLMCGGISGALAMATRTHSNGRPRVDLLIAYQLGRIGSYALAGASLGAIGAGFLQLIGRPDVQQMLRVASASMMAAVAVSLLCRGRGIDLGVGRSAWQKLAPLARRLLPVRTPGHALAFGALWGWMPCGLVYSVLLVAWLTMDPLRSASIMLLFGVGTTPAVLAGAFGARTGLCWLGDARVRSAAATMLLVMAVLTASAPWIISHFNLHMTRWLPFDCTLR